MTDALKESLQESVSQAGLLLQRHPALEGWKATRALTPEIAAFRFTGTTPSKRLRLVFYAAGETDENGFTYDQDTYLVLVEPSMEPHRFIEHDPEAAIDRVAEVMREVAD